MRNSKGQLLVRCKTCGGSGLITKYESEKGLSRRLKKKGEKICTDCKGAGVKPDPDDVKKEY